MRRHKAIFQEVRKTLGNHADKAIQRYLDYQNIDREQNEHLNGNQKQWK